MNKKHLTSKQKAVFVVLYWLCVGIAALPAASAHSFDAHNINAQIYGNTTATNGFPAYLNNITPSGRMPQSMWMVVRAPGNLSTFTLAINGVVIIQNQRFTDIANYSFTTKDLGNVPVQITVHSSEMNYTRVFVYHATILTVTKFISYEQKQHPVVVPSMSVRDGFIIFGLPAAAGVFTGILFAEYWRGQKNSNPDMQDYLIGGHGHA